jgi:adenosine deaminase
VIRVDHGFAAKFDGALMDYLTATRLPLTSCPMSSLRLKVVDRLEDYPYDEFLIRQICAMLNSDDPAYFGGYLRDVVIATQEALKLSPQKIVQSAINSWEASLLPAETKRQRIDEVNQLARAAMNE